MMLKKERLDNLLVIKKLIDSREKAKRLIMANLVFVDGVRVNKAGTMCHVNSLLTIEKIDENYVSRGGKKLEKALQEFEIEVKGCIVIDIGASTGGFTDCLLRHGAKKVYCIDVGYGQLDWSLRNDPRIVNLEKTNARYLKKDQFDFQFDLATIDVSFISLEKVLPAVKELLLPEGEVIALVKPQFEAGRENVKKGGIVKDPDIHQEVIIRLVENVKNDFLLKNITFSPLKNSPGNIEYFIYLMKNQKNRFSNSMGLVQKAVLEAHQFFK